MKSDKESLVSVPRAAMRLPEVHGVARRADDVPAGVPPGTGTQEEEDVLTYDESAGAPQVGAEADLPPEVLGVRTTRSFSVVVRMEKQGFYPERSPAALQPARRMSWLASKGYVCAFRLPTQS